MGDSDGLLSRCCVDLVKNGQEELLVGCMRSSGLVFVNGRQSQGQFTCTVQITKKGNVNQKLVANR